MKREKNTQQGFTLIELILYVSLVSIIMLTTSLFLSTLLESRIKNQTMAEVEQQGVQVMQIITQTLRNATSINSPAQGIGDSSLSIAVSAIGKSPTIFSISGNAIQMTEGGSIPIALTNSRVIASALTFQNLSRLDTPGIVRVQFTLTSVNLIGRFEYNYAKTFYASAALRHP